MADPNWQFFKPRALPGPGVATIDAAPALEGPARPPPSTAVSARSTNWTYGRPNIPTTARQAFDVEMPTDRSLTSRARELGARVAPGLQKAARFAKGVGTLGAGAEVVGHLGDYQIDDPAVDSSAAGTMRAVKEGDFSGAARSLGKGGLEALMDVGSIAANAADVFVPGDAPVSRAYNKTLRDQFGPQLVDNSGTLPDGGAGRGFVNPPMANPNAPGPTATATAPVTTSPARDAQIPLTAGVPASMGRDTGPLGHSQRADKDAGTLGGSLTNYLAGGGNGTPFDPTNGAGGGGPNRRLPTDLSPLQQGQVYKTIDPTTGRTVYSGRDVKEGATIRNGEGTATGKLSDNPNGDFIKANGVAPGEGARQDQLELQRLVAERHDREAGARGPSGGMSGIRSEPPAMSSSPPKGMSKATWEVIRNKYAQQKLLSDDQLAVQRAGNDNALRVAEMNNDARRYDTDTGANVTMRGQDMIQQNNLIQRQIAQGQREYDRFKDDRTYKLDLAKHGQAVADANRTARESEEKAWQGMAEKRFVGQDGKPDTQKIAQFNMAVDSTIPAFIKMLQQTGTPQALAKAKELNSRGKAAMGPEDHDLMQKLFEVSSIAEQSQGVLPGKGSVVRSQNLLDFMPKGKDTGLLGNPITVTNNGSRIPTNKLVYGVDDNAFLPTFEPKRSDLVSIR